MTTIPQPPPPPPPPMPGTSGAFSMPNWRDNYQPPIREKAPSKEQIDKQQYAHLPDKLLNAMNKDKKPFTYTPSGVSSEKGVLDLSEIRSPRMKKRLLANLHAGEEDEDQDGDQSYAAQQAKSPSSAPSANQYSASPLVLPPIPDSVQLRSPSPNSNRKEVRFAPSPIPMLACDDSEMLKKLAARKLDVEARAQIVTNDPVGQDTVDNGAQQQPQHFNNIQTSPPNYQESFEEDVDQICKNAADAVRTARGLADSKSVDQNNNNYEFNDETMAALNNDFNKMRFNQPCMVPQKHQQPSRTNNVGQFDRFPNDNLSNQSQQSVPNYNTDVLKHVLDAGLQDEIDKFEEMGAKMGSKSPENYYNPAHNNNHLPPPLPARPMSRPPPPPVPPRSNPNMYHDGRTSCPPFPNHQPEYQDQDFMNSFRCISPAIEILKKTQNTGYNYVTKPRPFYRVVDEESLNQSNRMNVSDDNFNLNTGERVIPIRMENGYSATLPRKIKLNQAADPRQPKSYENPELGRQYLPQAAMFSQLPPRPVMEDYSPESPGTPTQNKMFYGVNPKQSNQQQLQSTNFRTDNARSYVDPEAGRQYLSQAEMFSQLPPQSCLDGNRSGQSENDRYGFIKSRQSSLPPPPSVQNNHQNNNYNNYNRSWTPGPQSPGTMGRQARLSLSELRKLPPSERPHEPPPMKYTGANIPSRSFRLLQLITGEDVPNQFVQEDDEPPPPQQQQQQQQPQSRRARPPPPPVPPRSDSYRPASQQQQYYLNDPMERCASVTPNLPTTSMSSVYASSSLGTDF